MKYLTIFFILLLIIPLVSSLQTVKQGDDVFLSHAVRLNGAPSAAIDCNITIKDPDEATVIPFLEMNNNISSQEHDYFITGGTNTTTLGKYPYTITCTDGFVNETQDFEFEINPSGKEYIPEISSSLLLGAIISLIFISIILLVISARIENFPVKLFLMIMSGLFAIANIGFIVGSFQEFFSVSSSLSTAMGAFYILFITLLTGASVFLLIWLLVLGFKLYRIKRGFFDPQ